MMNFAYCHLSIVPVRSDHSDLAEIVTQLLFGEIVEIIEEYKQWRKIRIEHDKYEGWIDHKQCTLLEKKSDLNEIKKTIVLGNESILIEGPEGVQTIVRGAFLPIQTKKTFSFEQNKYTILGEIEDISSSSISEIAQLYLNAPYLWGGRNPFGIDCSGFTQLVFRFKGIQLNRDASQQVHQGEVISYDRLKTNDVVFFENAKGKVTHVGIYLGNNQIIHAHGQVRIDTLTLDGILNTDTKEISHDFHGIRRMD